MIELHERLLRRWRATRHPRIGDLCERVAAARLGEAPRAALAASKRRADLAAWDATELANDPLDFARLAAAARGGMQEHVIAHVQALAKRDDPALAMALLALLANPPYAGVKSRGMLDTIFDAIRASRDVRAAEPARELGRRYLSVVNSGTGGWASVQLAAIADELAAIVPDPLSAEDAAACDELEARFGKREVIAASAGAKTLTQLLEEIYANPADDGPRQIYADALLELGDPRGEWIALDLARARGELDAAGIARQQEVATSGQIAAWAYPLSNGGDVRFERGFPARIRLYRNAKDIVDARELATIHTITSIDVVPIKVALALFANPATAHVTRVVQFPTGSALEKCTASPRPWTSVSVACKAMPSLANLPALTDLHVGVETGAQLDGDAFAHLSLRSLSVTNPACDTLELPRTLEKLQIQATLLPALALDTLPVLREIELRFNGGPDNLAVPPSVTRVALTSRGYRPLPILSALPALEHAALDGIVARAQLAPLVRARELEISAREALPPDALVGFALASLKLGAERIPEGLLAEQTQLSSLRVSGAVEGSPVIPSTLTTLHWSTLSPSFVTEPAVLEQATLALVADEVGDFLARAPRLQRLELDARYRDTKVSPGAWVDRVRDSQLVAFTLELTPARWGVRGRIELVRDAETRRWKVTQDSEDETARAIVRQFVG